MLDNLMACPKAVVKAAVSAGRLVTPMAERSVEKWAALMVAMWADCSAVWSAGNWENLSVGQMVVEMADGSA